MYTLYYRISRPATKEENWTAENITDTSVTSFYLQLQYSKEYEVIVSAWNKLGESNRKAWHLTTEFGKHAADLFWLLGTFRLRYEYEVK